MILSTEGGALDSSTGKGKMEQMLLLQKELLQLQQEIEGTSNRQTQTTLWISPSWSIEA